jgi:acyl-coenzyme A thioesterase PaaI-like protein
VARPDPPLPPVFEAFFRDLEEQMVSATGSRFHECFGCGPAHPQGLRVRCFRRDGGVVSPIVIAGHFAGPPGAAHGGIVTACLDEVLAGAAASHGGRHYVTGELTVRFLRPTPVERPLLGRARAVSDGGRYLDLEGTLEEFETGTLVARATGRFFPAA